MDYLTQQINAKIASEDRYEAECPECDICGQRMTAEEYFYDIDGDYICPECLSEWASQFKKSIENYINERRYA